MRQGLRQCSEATRALRRSRGSQRTQVRRRAATRPVCRATVGRAVRGRRVRSGRRRVTCAMRPIRAASVAAPASATRRFCGAIAPATRHARTTSRDRPRPFTHRALVCPAFRAQRMCGLVPGGRLRPLPRPLSEERAPRIARRAAHRRCEPAQWPNASIHHDYLPGWQGGHRPHRRAAQ